MDSTSFYIVGGEGTWSLTEPLGKMSNLGNGTYVDTLTIGAPIYFVFADGGPEQWNNDWPTFNSTYRYGPASNVIITTGTEYSTGKRDNNSSNNNRNYNRRHKLICIMFSISLCSSYINHT